MKRIVLAEGNQDTRFILDRVLHAAGYEVESLTEGSKIIDGKTGLPDIFILDQELQVIDGFAISKFLRLKKETKKIPIIMLSPHPELQKKVSLDLMCLYMDKENIAWTGYWSRKGFFQLIPNSAPVARYAADTVKSFNGRSRVYNIINADQGRLWLTTSEGLQVFDPHTGSFQQLQEKDFPGLRGKIITPIAIDTPHKKAWLLAHPGYTDNPENWGKPLLGNLYEMDVSSKKCRPVTFKDLSGQTIPPSEFFIIPDMISFPATSFRNG